LGSPLTYRHVGGGGGVAVEVDGDETPPHGSLRF
jgi:hypothetical protein